MKRFLRLVAPQLARRGIRGRLPPVETPDLIRVERNHPKQLLIELQDPQQIAPIVSFINAKLNGWRVPWYGPPVGQVYLLLYKNGEPTANFYVGPWFFGRDYGEFLSQRATEQEVARLEQILGVPIVEIIESARPK